MNSTSMDLTLCVINQSSVPHKNTIGLNVWQEIPINKRRYESVRWKKRRKKKNKSKAIGHVELYPEIAQSNPYAVTR